MKDHLEITVYCPDENFRLSANLVHDQGVGGGKTAIVSLSHALARLGHNVRVVGHVEEGVSGGVEYVRRERVDRLETGLLLVTTSSKLDLAGLGSLKIDAQARYLWLHGVSPVKGMEDQSWDGIVCVSHFVKNHFLEKTRIPRERFSVIHNGIDRDLFSFHYGFTKRDPYRIVFASHPVKGLDEVIRIVDSLRKTVSDRFHLEVFGGYKLWGPDQPELNLTSRSVTFHGLLPQPELIRRLFACNFMINLYDIPEGFGLIYPQAMKAGVICIVSNVGGVSEVIRDGLDGFLVHDPFHTESSGKDAERIIAYLLKNPERMAEIRRNAMRYNRGWKEVAQDFVNLFQSGRIAGGGWFRGSQSAESIAQSERAQRISNP